MKRILNAAMRQGARVLASAVLLSALAGPALAAPGRPGPGKPKPGSPFNLKAATTVNLNANQWTCGLDNQGDICVNPAGSSVGGGGFWPQGTNNQYVFNTGLQMGAIIGPDGGQFAGDTVSDHFFDAYGAYGIGVPITNIFLSSDPNDLAAWPQDCYLTNPATGESVKTMSQLDSCVQYWDADPKKGFSNGHPMGLKVTQHSLEWAYSTNENIIFFIYTFTNASNDPGFIARVPGTPASGWTLTNMYAAFGADPDVSAAEAGDNFATVVPDQNMAVAWQYDFEASDYVPYAPNFDAAPGFFGVKFLKGPPNTADTAIIRRLGAVVDTVQPGEPLGITFFSLNTNGGAFPDPTDAHQAYRYLSGKLSANERLSCNPIPGMCYVRPAAQADVRFIESSGPFTLKPGESAQIVVAYVVGAPVPGTYVKGTPVGIDNPADSTRPIEKVMGRGYDQPGFPSLFASAKNAQAIFDVGFILPSAPPPPNVTVIPGDHQNTIVWDATPVNVADPYFAVASQPELQGQPNALYNPDYREKDFEGFRVYRKTDAAADWVPIAQFDLPNGINEQVTPITKALNLNGDTIVIVADTARVCPAGSAFAGCSADTGLKFAVVDRGGSFPSPGTGPGLVNGHRYFYAVTSFDINSPFSGPSTLESARTLTNSAAGLGAGSAIPRANAAGFVAADVSQPQIMGGGKALDVATAVKIDATTGEFSGPQPGANGLIPSLDVFDPQLIGTGDFSVRVDSVIPLNDAGVTFVGGHTLQGAPSALGTALAFFSTVTTPDTTFVARTEVPVPFGVYTDATVTADVVNVPVKANAAAASSLGQSANHYAGNFKATLSFGPQIDNSAIEDVGYLRAGEWPSIAGGSRWFVEGSPVAQPADSFAAGHLAGIDSIYGTATQYVQNANLRWQTYLLGGMTHSADYEVTWGDNGQIAGVKDLSNNVDLPFNENYRASWGVLGDVSGDGIVSAGDWWLISPVVEWWCAPAVDCVTFGKLSNTAKIQPLSTVAPGGYDTDVKTADTQGFGLYIAGERYLFATSQLPASGTKWILRTYNGFVNKDSTGAYSWAPNDTRSPAVPGLTAQVTVNAAATTDLATADLSKIHTVPDPYYVTNALETNQLQKQLLFVNLPPKAIIRIYSLSGTLIAALSHDDPSGGGQEVWDLRTRNHQYVASGVYFYHVEAPDGKTKVGKFTVVQYAQ